MRIFIFIVLLVQSCFVINGQTQSVDLSKITSIDQAKSLIEGNSKYEGKLYQLKNGQDAEEILSPLRYKKNGYTFTIANCTYKIVGIDSTLSFRVSYIYLDGNKLSNDEIDKLRHDIILKFISGEKFDSLVAKYNMDGNVTGDTNWFSEKMMIDEFEKEVRSHKKGDIFTVDIPKQNWHHVVLKTYDDTYLRNLTILKIKNSS